MDASTNVTPVNSYTRTQLITRDQGIRPAPTDSGSILSSAPDLSLCKIQSPGMILQTQSQGLPHGCCCQAVMHRPSIRTQPCELKSQVDICFVDPSIISSQAPGHPACRPTLMALSESLVRLTGEGLFLPKPVNEDLKDTSSNVQTPMQSNKNYK